MEQASAPATARSASQTQTRKSASGMGAKLIGGLGAVVTIATVAAFMMSSSPQPAVTGATQAATTLAAASTPAPVPPLTTAAVTPPPAVVAAPALTEQKDCKLLHRRFYMTGHGTIRLRTDGYISPMISLGDTPQMVDLPMLRPTQGEAEQKFVFEGKAPFLILTTDYVDFHQGLTVDGSTDYDMTWAPLKNC